MTPQSGSSRASIRLAWLVAAAAIFVGASIAATASAPQGQAAKSAPSAKPAQAATSAQAAKPVPEPVVKDMTAAEEEAWATAAEATTEGVCGASCHPIPEITRKRKTWREWNDGVAAMAALGVTATDEQLATVKLYMTRYYGAVNVNTASAAELSAVLGLSSKDAAAIIEYRKANGPFANAEALTKVDGIDKSKIEEQPEALRFN